MGTLFVIFCWLVFGLPLILLATQPCKRRSRYIGQKAESLQSALRGKIQLRYLIEGSLDISLCLAFQFYYQSQFDQGFSFDTPFMAINSVITILFTVVLSLLLPAIALFYARKRDSWNDEDFESQYGEMLDGLHKDHFSSLI